MHLFEVIKYTALVATLLNLALTLFVLARDYRSRLHRVYVLWGISVTLWNLGVYHLSQQVSPAVAFSWAKVLQLGVIFMPLTLFHLCAIVSGTRLHRWVLPSLYLIHAGFAVSLYFDCFITWVKWVNDDGYWSVPGLGFHINSIFYVALTGSALVMLYLKQRSCAPTQRTRLRAMLLAIPGMWLFGTNDMLPILFDNDPSVKFTYPLIHIQFCPLGSLSALFYVVVIGYSVLQHQLLDIHVTMSRFAAQLVRLTFMFLTGVGLLLVVGHFAPEGSFTSVSFAAAVIVLLGSAVITSFFFPQLFGRGTDRLERKILGDRFEYHARVQSVIETIRSFPEPQFALQEVNDLLAITVRVRSYQIILLDEATRSFVLYHSYPARMETSLAGWQIDSPIFRYFQRTRPKFLSCNSLYESDDDSALQREAREQLREFAPEFCFPFFSGEDLVGFMLIGAKTSDDLFTPHDLRLLTELSSSLGLLLNQIRLRHQLQVVHEQDLLGRMSRGLAHDLNNLLTPVQTLLQLMRESSLNQATIDELLPVGLRNLETVRTYVNEALFFSRASKIQGSPGSLNETVRDAVALVQPSADAKGIEIRFEARDEVMVEMDSVLIKRLVCNLLSNAVDATFSGSPVAVELAPLPKTELNRDWLRLTVMDQGVGISAENLQRVFTPYFTTKNTGDGKRGFGLGLAIARKIVHLHGGTLSIKSAENRGTTVQVDLPSKLHPAQSSLRVSVEAGRESISA